MNLDKNAKEPQLTETSRPSFITTEMIEKNPVLEVAGLFRGNATWQELREEVQRQRERDQVIEDKSQK